MGVCCGRGRVEHTDGVGVRRAGVEDLLGVWMGWGFIVSLPPQSRLQFQLHNFHFSFLPRGQQYWVLLRKASHAPTPTPHLPARINPSIFLKSAVSNHRRINFYI